MTVQELIDVLNKVEDKQKDVVNYDSIHDATVVEEIEEHYDYVILY